ncbi:MAG: hypothetical protein H8D94_01265 [Candidatus Pelagibacter sp.]|nr:hypothetical protein [Candidatus Pelagibacter sp.]
MTKLKPRQIRFINEYLKKTPGTLGKDFAREMKMGYSTYLLYKKDLADEILARQEELLDETMQYLKDKAPQAAATLVNIMETTLYDAEKRKAALDVLKMAGLYIDKKAIDLVVDQPEPIVLWDFTDNNDTDQDTDNSTD